MSSSGQASDLSMDEILASIRKIIAEDPKPAPAPSRMAPNASSGTAKTGAPVRSAAGAMIEAADRQAGSRLAAKSALDDDILDLMEEEGIVPPTATPPARIARDMPTSPAAAREPASETSAGKNEMWTPRDWSKTPETPPAAPPGEPSSEARLEAAIAALGQSLASGPTGDLGPKPIVVSSAPKAAPSGPRPGPQIDVVAVVNAASRAALAQRSADEQVALPVSALSPSVQRLDNGPAAQRGSTADQPQDEQTESSTTPAVGTISVHAAIDAATTAARTGAVHADGAHGEPGSQTLAPAKLGTAVAGMKVSVSKSAPVAVERGSSEPDVFRPATLPAGVPQSPLSTASASSAGAVYSSPESAGVQTLEDTVARMLRPMLRQWLDDNMPRIVEKAFKEELAAQAAPQGTVRRPN